MPKNIATARHNGVQSLSIDAAGGRVSSLQLFLQTRPAAYYAPRLRPLLDPNRLLKALNDDVKACREAARFISSVEDKQRSDSEFGTLTTHLMWAEFAGYDQSQLERIVRSLEANPILSGYQRWRKRSQAA